MLLVMKEIFYFYLYYAFLFSLFLYICYFGLLSTYSFYYMCLYPLQFSILCCDYVVLIVWLGLDTKTTLLVSGKVQVFA